jgi:exodeoxyribonuclease VII small subunit
MIEEKLKKIEELSAMIDSEDIPLEKKIDLYKEGRKEIDELRSKLTEMKLEIKKIDAANEKGEEV